MLPTRFTELLGCAVPIQQAPMGTFANPRLAAAVANAGGHGMVGVTGVSPEVVAARLDDAIERTPGPIGANFFLTFADPETLHAAVAAAAARAQVVDFYFGEPDAKLVEIVHQAGALAEWQVGSVEEARAAEAAGCDLIVAQGIEAGGHVRGTIGLLALLDEVLPSVRVPVLAAGGIGTGRAMAAALAAGADGVRVGTRFAAADEAAAHSSYVDALVAARPADTIVGDYFSYEFPGLPHRTLRSSVAAAQAFEGEIVGEFVDPATGERTPVHRLEKMTITDNVIGAVEAMPHWAGESVRGVRRRQTAAEIVAELTEEAERLLRRWSDAVV
jgi:NAD(P)H-dependent flavin oxidoreductase YrpB (nitropropane dioxygenase family)